MIKNGEATPNTQGQQPAGIIACIPCFNEELFIGSVVIKTRDYVEKVVVIDDGCTDKTALIAEKAGATVLKHDRNKGKGASVGTAFDYARGAKWKALVLLDGDGQHDPAFIPALIKPVLEDEADMVVGSRYLEIKSPIPRYRTWGQRMLTSLSNLGSSVKLTDSQSGLRAFSTKAIQAFSFVEEGLSVESEMQFLVKEAGLRVKEIPVSIGYHSKPKRSPLTQGLGVLNSVTGLISRRIPLLFFGVPGLAMFGFGLWEGVRVVRGYETTQSFWVVCSNCCTALHTWSPKPFHGAHITHR